MSHVSGSLAHELEIVGCKATRIGMDGDSASRLEDATAFGDLVQDRGDSLLGQGGAVQRDAVACGDPGLAGAAMEPSMRSVLASRPVTVKLSWPDHAKSDNRNSGNSSERGRPWRSEGRNET
jgi:hypothetical protein